MDTQLKKLARNSCDEIKPIYEKEPFDSLASDSQNNNHSGLFCNGTKNHICYLLEESGIQTDFICKCLESEMIVRGVMQIPLDILIRNAADEQFSEMYGIPSGALFSAPVIEMRFRNEDLHNPVINESQAISIKIVSAEQLQTIRNTALKINSIVRRLSAESQTELFSIKLLFGISKGQVLTIGEISCRTCDFRKTGTTERLNIRQAEQILNGLEK